MSKSRTGMSAAALMTIALSIPTLVLAHSFPETESPSAGQKLISPPLEVTIKFDAPIEKLFAKLEVVGPDGSNHAVGGPQVSDDGTQLWVKVPTLKPGDYLVKWAVVCIDTHHTLGSYTFTVANGGS
jgi:methionine-rich copper-binding protein CopC